MRHVIGAMVDEQIEYAKGRLEQQVRGAVGSIAMQIAERMSIDSVNQELVIRVDLAELRRGK